jgi:hypothetical protein
MRYDFPSEKKVCMSWAYGGPYWIDSVLFSEEYAKPVVVGYNVFVFVGALLCSF